MSVICSNRGWALPVPPAPGSLHSVYAAHMSAKFTGTIRTASAPESSFASWLKCRQKTKKAHTHPAVSRDNFQYICILYTHTHIYIYVCVCVKSLQPCPTLCDSMDCGPAGSSVFGISQARIPEWVAISSSGDLPLSGIKPVSL